MGDAAPVARAAAAAGCVRPAAARTALLWSRAFSRRFRLGASPFPKENVASQRVASRLLTFWFSVSTPLGKKGCCHGGAAEMRVAKPLSSWERSWDATLGSSGGGRLPAPAGSLGKRFLFSAAPRRGQRVLSGSLLTPTAGVGAAEFRAPGALAASWMLWFLSQPLGLC